MDKLTLENILAKRYWIGLAAILVSIIAWTSELVGAVYICPYCRVQRTVIGLLGLVMILPIVHHFITKYAALVVGFFGSVVAANQHFMGWKKISAGEFKFNDNILIDPFILSGCSLFIIIGLTALILNTQKLGTKSTEH